MGLLPQQTVAVGGDVLLHRARSPTVEFGIRRLIAQPCGNTREGLWDPGTPRRHQPASMYRPARRWRASRTPSTGCDGRATAAAEGECRTSNAFAGRAQRSAAAGVEPLLDGRDAHIRDALDLFRKCVFEQQPIDAGPVRPEHVDAGVRFEKLPCPVQWRELARKNPECRQESRAEYERRAVGCAPGEDHRADDRRGPDDLPQPFSRSTPRPLRTSSQNDINERTCGLSSRSAVTLVFVRSQNQPHAVGYRALATNAGGT